MNVTYLGPFGSTFTHVAYEYFVQNFGAPAVSDRNYIPTARNGDVVSVVMTKSAWGALAVETLAQGRVTESLDALIALLRTGSVPAIVAGYKMPITFALMARKGMSIEQVAGIIGHQKSFGACKAKVGSLQVKTMEVPSNGEASRLVAEDESYQNWACLGPVANAQVYGLDVLIEGFEDEPAVTTFYLLAPGGVSGAVGKTNRAVLTFQVHNIPGALWLALTPLVLLGINMTQIHSVHIENGTYHFGVEVEMKRSALWRFRIARKLFSLCVTKNQIFGPFEVRD